MADARVRCAAGGDGTAAAQVAQPLLAVRSLNGERLRVTIDWPQIDRDEITKEHGVAQVLAAAILWAAEAAEVHPDEMLEAVTTRMSELEYCGKPQ